MTKQTYHHLELIEPYFTDMREGRKTFEVRDEREDRQFNVGDVLIFHDSIDWAKAFRRQVRYVLRDAERFGVQEGTVVMGLEAFYRHELTLTEHSPV